ncbi:MAG: hypothetical protein MJE77_05445 [Proteobacteria bacterium]|nr:hypothetical protein [Pseudomonadota bacterium]
MADCTESYATEFPAGLGRPHFGQPFDRTIEHGESATLERGVVVFSLDLELAVASVDDRSLYRSLQRNIAGTRQAVRRLLALCVAYRISATWAIVGQLFRSSPTLDLQVDSWVQRDIPDDQLCAPELLDEIQQCPVGQDIGSHSYRHVNMAAADFDDRMIGEELAACQTLARGRGLTLDSFVFPFNRVARLNLLAEHGFTCFRGANSDWYTRGPAGNHRLFAFWRSALKQADDFLAVPPPVDVPRRVPAGLWMIPHSMMYKGAGRARLAFLRGVLPDVWLDLASDLAINRQVVKAARGIRRAVARRGVFHLWTHPQNLGQHTGRTLAGLENVFRLADRYRRDGRLDIMNMAQLTSHVQSRSTSADPKVGAGSMPAGIG